MSDRRADSAALWCCVGAGFATLLDSTVISYTAPAVTADLRASVSEVQWFLAAYSLTFGLGLVPAGRLGDAYGRRGLLLSGLGCFLVGAVLSAIVTGMPVLIGARLLQGTGAGLISAQVLGLIQDHYSGTARLRALGAYTAAGAAAAIAGPVLAGAVLAALPGALAWRVVLLLPAPFIVVTMWLAWRRLPRARAATRDRVALDLPGIAMLGALVVLVTLPAVDPGVPAAALATVLAAAAALVAGLVVWERRYHRGGRMPLFAPPLMRSPGFLTGNLVALLWFGSLLASGTATTIHLLQRVGIPALPIALLLVPAALARLIAARYSSTVFARLRARAVTLCVGAEALGLAVLAVTATAIDGWGFAILLAVVQVVLGVCSGLGEPVIRALTLSHAPPGMSGVAASFLQLAQRLSATFMVALATGMLLSDGASPVALRNVLLLCCALTAIAAAVSARRAFGAEDPAPRTIL